ncbi:hypothetical protein [Limnoglobus roseus]|uniref:Uncharacterized protein n=1 Tax=Limnoglobus roseus TaxID=2598579 RepID=A0A5C1ALR2_9BACT|nr:hypothetical protein [Limnoglobus roseus]QEL19900.1 hypothetical protein PX52LOC_06982 [Limnoglobus roseus]
MRRAVMAGALVSAFGLWGCGESQPHAKRPVDPSAGAMRPPKDEPKVVTPDQKGKAVVPEPYQRAEDGPFKFGDATITVEGVLWGKYKSSPIDVAGIGVRIEYSATAKPATIKGVAADDETLRRLTGSGVTSFEHLPIRLTAATDAGEKCRLLMRFLSRLDAGSDIKPTQQEMKAYPGVAYRWTFQFERPSPTAKRIMFELPAEDMGGQGTIRLDVPNQDKWKLEN